VPAQRASIRLAEIIRRGSGRAGARIRAVYSFSKGEVLATELSLEEHGGTMELAFEGLILPL
jgi:hypothetical protein